MCKIQNQHKNNLGDTKGHIQKITINNDWNTQIFQILREKRDGTFF